MSLKKINLFIPNHFCSKEIIINYGAWMSFASFAFSRTKSILKNDTLKRFKWRVRRLKAWTKNK